jgi:hypothetical protein
MGRPLEMPDRDRVKKASRARLRSFEDDGIALFVAYWAVVHSVNCTLVLVTVLLVL